MMELPAEPAPRTDERRDRRRVGALLNQYYAIEGSDSACRRGQPAAELESELDRQGFDARRYFDGVVASGQLPELAHRTAALEAEVRELDGHMQTLVYENYSKFIRATDVIREMKVTIDGLAPDLRRLEGSMNRAAEHQDNAEAGVSVRGHQLDCLLKQQQVCRKLRVLFGLPEVLRRCLECGAHARAVAAYRCCAGVLRQHRDVPAFQSILDQAEVHIASVREALQAQLRCPGLSVEEAVSSAITLVNLGEEQGTVAAEYLTGRVAMLRQSCRQCFEENVALAPAEASCRKREGECREDVSEMEADCPAAGSSAARQSQEQEERERPGAVAFRGACSRAAELHVPRLCSAVEGLRRLQDFCATPASMEGSSEDRALADFVARQVDELCEQVSRLAERQCPPTRVLVSCVQSLRESLQRLDSLIPRLVSKLFASFVSRAAADATKARFSHAAVSLVSNLGRLHEECLQLQRSNGSGLDHVLERIAAAEEAIIMGSFSALTNCQPLLGLIGPDRPMRQQLVQGVQAQLITFFLAFVEACHIYVGHDASEAQNLDPSLPAMARVACKELEEVASWEWSGLFGLALVRIGRHLEVKAIGNVMDVARELFASGDFTAAELQPHPAVLKATRSAAQAVITHYVIVNGQRLSNSFRSLICSVNSALSRDCRDHRAEVSAVLKEVHAVDGQLACILSDPRKAREASHQHRTLNRFRNSMELEMERLWAKKLQVYAPIPFNRNGAILGVMRIGFKALYEYVREQTFAKSGLHQVQVDCTFLQEAVREFVEAEDAGVLESLLDEAVTSASQRCPEPELLEGSVVEALCEEWRQKIEG